MLQLLNRLKKELENISIMEKVERYAKEDLIKTYNYSATIQIEDTEKYKKRTKRESLVFINLYSTDNDSGDLRVDELANRVVESLDEKNLSDTTIKIHKLELQSILKATFDEQLDCWRSVCTFVIRWEDL